MMTVYINWENQEVLTEKEIDEKRREALDLTEVLGRSAFKDFCDYDGYRYLIDIITAEDKEEAVNSLMVTYAEYINDQLDDIYEEIILD